MLEVSDVVDLVIKIYGKGIWRQSDEKTEFTESEILHLDSKKSKTQLDWNPKFDINESIKKTIDWYKYKGNNTLDFCFKQIDNYCNNDN